MYKILYFDIETIKDHNRDTKKVEEKYPESYMFMPEASMIITICVGQITSEGKFKTYEISGTEAEKIDKFFKLVERSDVTCGFNIKGFDLPFIVKRALHHGIAIPLQLKLFGRKPWEVKNVLDLMEVYKYGVYGASGNLDTICDFLGITSPKEKNIDGSLVQKYYDEGKIEEITEYCKRDVEATYEVYKRFVDLNLI